MIGYTTLGVSDLDRATKFYTDLFAEQGAKLAMDAGRIRFIGKAQGEPMLAICTPYDEQAPAPGNGTMVAFPASSKEEADKMHAKAIELGASDEGAPGQRIPDRFYGGYVRDLDGNKLCFFVFG